MLLAAICGPGWWTKMFGCGACTIGIEALPPCGPVASGPMNQFSSFFWLTMTLFMAQIYPPYQAIVIISPKITLMLIKQSMKKFAYSLIFSGLISSMIYFSIFLSDSDNWESGIPFFSFSIILWKRSTTWFTSELSVWKPWWCLCWCLVIFPLTV